MTIRRRAGEPDTSPAASPSAPAVHERDESNPAYCCDRPLWEAYFAAETSDGKARHRAEIVAHHFGYILNYARKTLPPHFRSEPDAVDEYANELAADLLARIDDWDPDRGVPVMKWVRNYWRNVRHRMESRADDWGGGIETRRIRVAIRQIVKARQGERLPAPTPEELSEEISSRHGKKIGPGRIRSLMALPDVVSGDERVGDEADARTVFEELDGGVDPEAVAIAAVEEEAASALVADLLDLVELSSLDRAIIAERLMAPEAAAASVLARRYGITAKAVTDAERALIRRFRGVLGLDDIQLDLWGRAA